MNIRLSHNDNILDVFYMIKKDLFGPDSPDYTGYSPDKNLPDKNLPDKNLGFTLGKYDGDIVIKLKIDDDDKIDDSYNNIIRVLNDNTKTDTKKQMYLSLV